MTDNYHKQADLFCMENGVHFTMGEPTYGHHFVDDKDQRYIFPVKISRMGRSYSLKFGQSIAAGSEYPTPYDVLSCLQKYEVGSLEDFAGEYGYSLDYEDYKKTRKVYNAVRKEWEAVERLFGDVMDELREIV